MFLNVKFIQITMSEVSTGLFLKPLNCFLETFKGLFQHYALFQAKAQALILNRQKYFIFGWENSAEIQFSQIFMKYMQDTWYEFQINVFDGERKFFVKMCKILASCNLNILFTSPHFPAIISRLFEITFWNARQLFVPLAQPLKRQFS